MKRYPILDLCARVNGHQAQYKKLAELCDGFTDWDNLFQHAENEGMSPLLHKHLTESKCKIPPSARQVLTILVRRHQHKAKVRIDALKEILELLRQNDLTPILIKGAALCHTTYPDPALRPMRDMDVLMRKNEASKAQELIEFLGFSSSSGPIPSGHFHLPALMKEQNGVTLCIELHTGLYPDCPPYYPEVDFEEFLKNARRFTIDDVQVLTLGEEDTIHYVYQHGFRMPLTFEPFKLINAADLTSFTEKYYEKINWVQIQKCYPNFFNALPLFHHLTSWDFAVIPPKFVSTNERNRNRDIVHFTGWPKVRLKGQKALGKKFHQIVFDTFFPPSWWLKIYYGIATKRAYLLCLVYRHPRHIAWWIVLYSSFLSKEDARQDSGAGKGFFKKLVALFKKLK